LTDQLHIAKQNIMTAASMRSNTVSKIRHIIKFTTFLV